MRFECLRVANLRCFDSLEYRPEPGVNLVCGPNGSGKTSVLEAFSLASLGRSFLSGSSSELVKSGTEGLSVRAMLRAAGEGTRAFSVVVRKKGGETRIELDGIAVLSASSLAQKVPMLAVNSRAPDLLTDNPGNRRALVDRTMFHVEPEYVDQWKRYRAALRQRNKLLHTGASARERSFWHESLSAAALAIDHRRRQLVTWVNDSLAEIPFCATLGGVEFAYAPGWNAERSYREQLDESWERDQRLGFTYAGIHRADLTVRAGGRGASRRLSRGQAKYLVVAVLCSLRDFMESKSGQRPVFVVDDLRAELDDMMCADAVDMIVGRGGQTIFTAIRPQDLPAVAEHCDSPFHVEHHQSSGKA